MIRLYTLAYLPSSITPVGKDSLPGNPRAIRAQELDNRRNVLDVRQAAVQSVGLVEGDGFGAFLGVEKG